ncbi:SDR family oxidoreductase [Solimicrobium silvestre]|uniref:Dehydrogenases with different specificities (Related to short-chain alcohol dehydrogenases) n=1 Tax=Solimicrobium silvestre TaxID=2099400 RepID=A0A2S9GXW7_9BURK|nr:SDR family oxidoreductase [Solimicrobium silvestre]PRC92562.1 Dehydrogenases with different specificities (related to short-chain alcohol dehydrogenases) [Solimicrobium silvestre]
MKRNVLITGACGGIGRVLCQRFIAAGDFVYAQDKNAAQLSDLIAELGAQQSAAVLADLTNAQNLQAELANAVAQHGDVDVVVANAGAAEALTLATTTEASWKSDIDLNLNGTFHTVEAVRSAMQKNRKGNIVIIGSVNGITSFGHPAYSVAKAGLISYTKALAMEFGKFGIRANIVCPGTVKTQAWQARAEKNPQIFDELKKWYPLGDFATPDDIADAVLFLASDAARVITGVMLPVDGGLMAGNRVFAAELTQEDI